jgi:type IV pilus assembly protein PilX
VNRRGLKSPQGGIALLLALVVLLLVTILGLVGLESAVLELRMAGAQREYALAYQAAQGALNDGERVLKGLSAADLASFEDNRAGRYLPAAPGAPSRASAVDWSSNAVLTPATALGAPVQRQPRYLLEYLGAEDGGTWHRFRMTARGYGAEGGLEVTVQRTLGLTLP